MTSFDPDMAILPHAQRVVWPRLEGVPSGFVLYGGTALALRFGHRESVDFDFFSSESFVPLDLFARIPFLTGGQIAQQEEDVLTVFLAGASGADPVKVSFFGGLDMRVLETPDRTTSNGILVASARDIAGTKAKTIQQRVEYRDYQDIQVLLREFSLAEIVGAGMAIFPGQLDPDRTAATIGYFGDPVAQEFPAALKDALRHAVAEMSEPIVPIPLFQTILAAAASVER